MVTRARTIGRKIAWSLSLFVLIVTGCLGLYNGVTELNDPVNALQRSVNVGVLLYGLLGLVTAYGLVKARDWALWTSLAWAVVITYVPPAAIMGYSGDEATWGSALTAAAASALIGAGVVWTAILTTRERASEPGRSPSIG